MPTRAERKHRAKANLKRSYWAAIAVCFVLAFVTGEFYESTTVIHSNSEAGSNYAIVSDNGPTGVLQMLPGEGATALDVGIAQLFNFLTSQHSWVFKLALGGLGLLAAAVMLGFRFLICFPLQVGGRRFFLVARHNKAEAFELGYSLRRGHFKNTVITMFLRDVFISLWSLLLIVPGIVKSYEYRMVPYLLAEDPTVGHREIFRRSRALMRGNKWQLFVQDMSFFLWRILSGLTFGLAGIFYVNPYIVATECEFFADLRNGEVMGRG